MAGNNFDVRNIDPKTGKPKAAPKVYKPEVIIGVNTKAKDYKPPSAAKPVVVQVKKPAPVAKAAAGEGIREAITATKRREKEAGLD